MGWIILAIALFFIIRHRKKKKQSAQTDTYKESVAAESNPKKKLSLPGAIAIIIAVWLGIGAVSLIGDDKNNDEDKDTPSQVVQTQDEKEPSSGYDPDATVSGNPPSSGKTEPEPEPEPEPEVDPEQAFRDKLMQYNYVGSSESDKYHKPTCRWTDKINDENLVHFDTEEEAVAAGYKPCGTCKP